MKASDIGPLPKPQILCYWGYPVEEHAVHTEDGYILIHHIAHGRNENPVCYAERPQSFCNNAYYVHPVTSYETLADAGFDVWLGNVRGNTYGLGHEKLKPNQSKFWDLYRQYNLQWSFSSVK